MIDHTSLISTTLLVNRVSVYINECFFTNNFALLEAGVIMSIQSIIKIMNSLVFNCSSGKMAGFISLNQNSIVFLFNLTASKSSSQRGAFSKIELGSNLFISKAKIQDFSGEIGILIFQINGLSNEIQIENSSFFRVISEKSFLFSLEHIKLTLINTEFINCSEVMILTTSVVILKWINFKSILCKMKIKCCLACLHEYSIGNMSNISIINLRSNNKKSIFFAFISDLYVVDANFSQIITLNKINSLFFVTESKLVVKNLINYWIDITIMFAYSCNISIENSVFSNQNLSFNLKPQGIVCYDCFLLTIIYCKFLHLNGDQNGTCVYLSSLKRVYYEIINSVFLYNSAALSAAAVYHYNNAKGIISKCIFSNHLANIGGCINFFCEKNLTEEENCYMNIFNNKFMNNFAFHEGGVLKWNYKPPSNIDNNYFINNSAINYGDDVANIPIRIRMSILQKNNKTTLLNFTENITFSLNNVESGFYLPYTFEIFFLDYNFQIFKGKINHLLNIDLI